MVSLKIVLVILLCALVAIVAIGVIGDWVQNERMKQ
jgi:TRAP-type C4-dicarboxylate transport system permease small subunit